MTKMKSTSSTTGFLCGCNGKPFQSSDSYFRKNVVIVCVAKRKWIQRKWNTWQNEDRPATAWCEGVTLSLIHISGALGLGRKNRDLILHHLASPCGGKLGLNNPVSYTPLDVYKRQIPHLETRDSARLRIPDKKDAFLYWIDALGVEYLSYIAILAKKKGLSIHVDIAYVELPTITLSLIHI